MNNYEFQRQLIIESAMFDSPLHGLEHWKRVERNGLYLCQFTNADPKVVSYFAYLHDSMRANEWIDPEHGSRSASYAKENRSIIDLNDAQFDLLIYACSAHTTGRHSDDDTVSVCWDADRLDIGRVGKAPEEKYFFTAEAKRIVKTSSEKRLIEFDNYIYSWVE